MPSYLLCHKSKISRNTKSVTVKKEKKTTTTKKNLYRTETVPECAMGIIESVLQTIAINSKMCKTKYIVYMVYQTDNKAILKNKHLETLY